MFFKKSPEAIFTFLLALLLTLLIFTSQIYTQQEERSLQPQLTRDHSLFPLQSTGIWTEVHPLIPRVDYWGVHFVNADTGWAVGEGGAIIKTTNGGEKWIWYESGVENTLRTVAAVNNGQRVISAGDGGKILISEDAGETWSQLSSPTIRNIWNMQMITNEIGWMVGEGATALKTTDTGLTWIQQTVPHTTLPYWDVSFIDTSFGYICCNSAVVLKTTNGGGSWQIQQAGDTRSLFTIYAFDTVKASAGGFAGKIVYTTDGGNTWLNATGAYAEANKIKFINDTLGFMAANGGFCKSTDGGMSWFIIHDLYRGSDSSPSTNLSFTTGTNGYVTGINMLLGKTIDNGESWERTINNDDFINVYFKNEKNGLINSNKFIYTTKDGGASLDTLKTFPYFAGTLAYLLFLDSLTGFMGMQSMKIFKTTNGGVNWYSTNITGLVDTLGLIQKIFFFNKVLGWAVSTRGYILGTSDGGENWTVQLNLGISRDFKGIHFFDHYNGWATSRYLYKTSDGGITWEVKMNNGIFMPWDVYFINDSIGFCTESNNLYRTTNGGTSWGLDSLVSGFGQGRFTYFNSFNFFIVASKVFRTTDAGITWRDFPELEGPDWRLSLSLISVNSGYLVGDMGWIVKYFDDSITFIPGKLELDLPKDFYLFQNYPNPFNSFTIIKYSLPEKSFVNISLYDIKGGKISELVNEEKERGVYIINFEGDKFSTGVYLYRMLTSSGYSSSKKLILLK